MTFEVFLRSGARMDELDSETVPLVLTGPPYWPAEVEAGLKRPPAHKHQVDALSETLISFALSLRPVLGDCFRVMQPGGALVMQTRDLRFGDRLVPLAAAHRQMMEALGFDLFTQYAWQPGRPEPDRVREVVLAGKRGRFRPVDPELFLVFLKPGGRVTRGAPTEVDRQALGNPCLTTERGRLPHPHRWQAPLPVCETFVRTFTLPSDLVVDPFAGHGTTLLAAERNGRRSIGYDIEPGCVEAARKNVEAIRNA